MALCRRTGKESTKTTSNTKKKISRKKVNFALAKDHGFRNSPDIHFDHRKQFICVLLFPLCIVQHLSPGTMLHWFTVRVHAEYAAFSWTFLAIRKFCAILKRMAFVFCFFFLGLFCFLLIHTD